MKPYLTNVPVKVNIWIRPDCQRKQFEVLKQARPSIMFLQSDGGRNEKEWEAIRQNRAIFDKEIDWECMVYKLYEEKNNGLYAMGRKTGQLIWSTVDRCIFLEDDFVPSVSYFKFCEELLEKYKDDTRINAICAMTHTGTWDRASSDYFFSETGSIWGMATWKRTYDLRASAFNYTEDNYSLDLLKERAKDDKYFVERVLGYAKNETYGGHVAGAEFFHALEVYGHNQLFIVPKKNMMCNIGCTPDSAHAADYNLLPRATRKIFNMKTYEYDFPLKHPFYVIADKKYSKAERKIMAYDRPFINFCRRIESAFLVLKYKGFKGLFKKIKKVITNKNKKTN